MLSWVARRLRGVSCLSSAISWGKRRFYVPYQAGRMQVPDFPPEVWIENTNRCNAHCVMCPRELHTRPQGIMNLDLYHRIIDEVAEHRATVERVHMHNFGEPLLDVKLSERVAYAKSNGIRHVYFVTNGSLLTEARSRELVEAGLDEFKVSFYGIDAASYARTMKGLTFETSLANLQTFFKVREELGGRTPAVVIQYLPVDGDASRASSFRELFEPMIRPEYGDRLNVFALHNFGGGKEHIPLGTIDTICPYPWKTFVILQDGRVSTCCFDYNGAQIVGDVTKNTIAEIWHGEACQALRKRFQALEYRAYPVCMKCSVIRSTGHSGA